MKLSCFLCQMACHDGCHVGGPGLLSGLQVPWGHLYILTSQPGAWQMGVVSKCPPKSWRGDTDPWRPYQLGARPNSPSTPDCRCRGLGRSPMPESRSTIHAVTVTTRLLLWKLKETYAHWLHSSRSKIRVQGLFLTMVITTAKDWADGQSQGCATLGDTGNGDDCVLRVWYPRPASTQLSLQGTPNVQQVKRKPALLEFRLGGRTCTLNAGETAYLPWLLWPRALDANVIWAHSQQPWGPSQASLSPIAAVSDLRLSP